MFDAVNLPAAPSRMLEGDRLSVLADEELGAQAQSLALATPANTRPVRLGVLSFWAVVVVLLTARFFAIDPAALKPLASTVSPVVTAAGSIGAKL